jgi:hypothetical protein
MGLAALQRLRDLQAKSVSTGVRWLAPKQGKKYRIRLLQELDNEARNFSEKMGVARLTVEHTPPKEIYGEESYKKKFLCTNDEGSCYGCEQDDLGVKGWRGKGQLYVNVVVDDGDDDPYVAVWRQSTYEKNDIVNQLSEIVDDDGTWADRDFKLTRKGEGLKTAYTLIPQGPSEYDVEKHAGDLFDLHTDAIVKHVPYDKQEAFVNAGAVVREEVDEDVDNDDDGDEVAW